MPSGPVIDLRRIVSNLAGSDDLFVDYRIDWRIHPESWREMTHAALMESGSLADALRLEPPGSEIATVEAVTRYEVAVTLNGRKRRYQAAFLWLHRGPGEWRFLIADQIVPGVDQAVVEGLPTRAEAELWMADTAAPLEKATAAIGETQDCWDETPIVIDLGRSGFRFTSAADGVDFDIDADGRPERIAWTAPESGLAFLAADWNGNGRIDDGRELFGNHAPQPRTREPHGYLSLRWFDEVEGDGDGAITREDFVFDELLLWQDANHNGISEPEELARLEWTSIEAVETAFVTSRRRDRHGNELRYRSKVRLARDGAAPRPPVFAADVILTAQRPTP